MNKKKNYRIVDGHIRVKNYSAYFLEEITYEETIHSTTYIVDGSYEGTETLPSKLKRILANEEMRADYAYVLHELIKAIYVEAPDKSSGHRVQRIHIKYDLVGYIPVDELIAEKRA